MFEKEKWETFQFEMQLIPPLWDMANRGVRIDKQAMLELHVELDVEAKEMSSILNGLTGEDINVKSTQQVGNLLFNKLGIPKGGLTAGGAPKVDDKTLAALDPRCSTDVQKSVIRLIRDIRERRDLISKFCEITIEDDGRMRGHYNPAGTDTGRLAGKKFYPTDGGANPQNFPKDKRVRKVFIPDTGTRFGYADLERAESFVVAHLSHDPRMLANHGPGIDAHKRVGSFLFDRTEDEVDGDTRYLAKRTAHAGNYMMGPQTFMDQVNADTTKTGISISRTEAKKLLDGYKEYYAFLPAWWNNIEDEVRGSKHLCNLLGRPRQFFDAIGRCLPTVVAYKPQSTVGDTLNVGLLNSVGSICKYANRYLDTDSIRESAEELKRCGYEMLLQVHDAIAFQYNEGEEATVAKHLSNAMSIPLYEPDTGESFMIPIEMAFGPSWGEVKVYHA